MNTVAERRWVRPYAAVLLLFALAVTTDEAPAGEGVDAAPRAITVAGRASGADPATVAGRAVALLELAEERGRVRVIVEVGTADGSRPGRALADGAMEAGRRGAIAGAQRDLLTRTGITLAADAAGRPQAPASLPAGVSGLRLLRTIPYISLFADRAILERLLDDPHVVMVRQDLPMTLALDESVPLINADEVWDRTTGSGVAVAVVDTGVDKDHPFLQSRVVGEACFSTTTDGNPPSTSLCPGGGEREIGDGTGTNCSGVAGCSHGTHIAGIVAGRDGVDEEGNIFHGVARGAEIIAIQVFSRSDDNRVCKLITDRDAPCIFSWESDGLAALDWIVDEAIHEHTIAAVNISYGGGDHETYCDEEYNHQKVLIDNLRLAGITTAAAAGNGGHDDAVSSPACISTVVAVAASNKDDTLSSYTNWGEMIDVVAPGTLIRSSVVDEDGHGYERWSGTSMAAPHVAGGFALLMERYPHSTAGQREAAIASSVTSLTYAGVTKPRLDMAAALDYFRGSLHVTLGPEEAVAAGARWRRAGGDWQGSGVTEEGIETGDYTVTFSPVAGWIAPDGLDVTIGVDGETTSVGAVYIPVPVYIPDPVEEENGIGDDNGDGNGDENGDGQPGRRGGGGGAFVPLWLLPFIYPCRRLIARKMPQGSPPSAP